MQVIFVLVMSVVGACMGSFLCCQVRRMHEVELKKQKLSSLPRRSVCMHCRRQLKWYDNIPIVSWIMLGGRCRKCKKKIGIAEILAEIGMAAALGGIATLINVTCAGALGWVAFVVLVILVLTLGFLAIYDGLYGELPNTCLIVAIGCGVVLAGLRGWSVGWGLGWFGETTGAVAILGGVYLVLYLVSHGKWVGDGDWLLGTAIGLALDKPWLALLALCLANILACLVMLPVAYKRPGMHIHFGPFLVIAWVIVATILGGVWPQFL